MHGSKGPSPVVGRRPSEHHRGVGAQRPGRRYRGVGESCSDAHVHRRSSNGHGQQDVDRHRRCSGARRLRAVPRPQGAPAGELERFPIPVEIDRRDRAHARPHRPLRLPPAAGAARFRGARVLHARHAQLAGSSCPTAAHLQEEEANYANRMGYSKHVRRSPSTRRGRTGDARDCSAGRVRRHDDRARRARRHVAPGRSHPGRRVGLRADPRPIRHRRWCSAAISVGRRTRCCCHPTRSDPPMSWSSSRPTVTQSISTATPTT